MSDNRAAALRQELERYDVQMLEEMLRQELENADPDGGKVRAILHILKIRDGEGSPEYGPETAAAWEAYRDQIPENRPRVKASWFYRAVAAAAAVCLILLAIPQNVAAESFFERLMRWTDSIFELFSPGEENDAPEYEFRTEHPGLQQVYDAVTGLGITDPVVPMWIPDEYELVECKITDNPSRKGVVASFGSVSVNMVFKVETYSQTASNEYYKDRTSVEAVEMSGVTHNVMRNDDSWVVVWVRENIECFIRIDCREDVLREILRSIYVMEE